MRPIVEIEPNSKALNCGDALTYWILDDFQGYFLAVKALQSSWYSEVMKPLFSFSSYSQQLLSLDFADFCTTKKKKKKQEKKKQHSNNFNPS